MVLETANSGTMVFVMVLEPANSGTMVFAMGFWKQRSRGPWYLRWFWEPADSGTMVFAMVLAPSEFGDHGGGREGGRENGWQRYYCCSRPLSSPPTSRGGSADFIAALRGEVKRGFN